MAKNGQASWNKTANYVNLTHMPTPKTEYQVNFEKLTGGLNLYAPDYRLKLNESPDMENMLWKNGTLCSRYGQTYTEGIYPVVNGQQTARGGTILLTSVELQYWPTSISSVTADDVVLSEDEYTWDGGKIITLSQGAYDITVRYAIAFKNGEGYTCFQDLYWDNAFFHIGTGIYYGVPGPSMTLTKLCELRDLYTDYTPSRGTFLRYGDDLFYKARGVFLRIHWDGAAFSYADVAATAYTPITYINADWRNGSGDAYQPENRLSAKKTIWYNAGTDEQVQTFSGDGTTTSFSITLPDFVYVSDVTVNGATVGNWTVSGSTLTFYQAPASGTNNIVVKCQCAVKTYYLPVKGASIEKITVDGLVTTAYTYDPTTGLVTFTSAPPVTQPLSNNTVRITYALANDDAFNSIMDCPYAIVYGGNQNICMVVGGCTAQPNAFFWNGNNIAMDVGYWPMEQYNFGADTEDEITGFGRQQGYLVVFKKRSVGKGELQFTTTTVSSDTTARTAIEIDYTNINSQTGCDLPWSIQLIENNLVFCNTKQGVHIILDSSAAYENNIITISIKVNGDTGRSGLLKRVREASRITSFDDNHRYWIVADDRVFCWDYELSAYKDPSWFYLTGVNAASLFMDVATIYHLNPVGRVTVFDNSYADYGGDFERRYQFATQYFRSYDRLKTVREAIFTFRPDTDFKITVTYMTDYGERVDITDETTGGTIRCQSWRLVPRNLRWRDLAVVPFAYVARRRPGCRHVRHFSVRLTCTGAGYDMPILSAQIFYTYEGRDR